MAEYQITVFDAYTAFVNTWSMNQSVQTTDKVSICHKNTCIHVEGNNARIIGEIAKVGAVVFITASIVRFLRQL